MGVEKIEYKGKKILCIDYKEAKSQDQLLTILRESVSTIGKTTGWLIFTDLTNASLGPDFMKEAKESSKGLVENVDKAAVIGVTGLKKILLKGYNLFVDSEKVTKVFDTKEEALDYLVS